MGVKYAREYADIMTDLIYAVSRIEDFYDFIQMPREEWESMDNNEKGECIKTVCDDIFYVLGEEKTLDIGKGVITYNNDDHNITVFTKDKTIRIIPLI